MTRARTGVWLATACFAAGFSALAVLRQRTFSAGRFDLGNMVQTVWSTAHGRPLEMTDLAGEQISRLGAHFDPLLAAFAPLWWLWPDPSLLLVVQAVAVSLGALPVYWLACKHLGSERAGAAFALAYLLYAPTQWLALDDFHAVALATPLLLLGLWYLDEDRLLPFAVVATLACLTKEQIPLVVAAFGVWYALARGRRRAGAAICAAGLVVGALAIVVVVPHFAPGGSSPFAGRYAEAGGTPGGILQTAFTDPARVLGELVESRDLHYLFELLVGLGGLSLLAPLALVTAVPELAANLLSSTRTQTSIHFHYTAGAIPGLMLAAILGAASISRRRPAVKAWLPTALVVVALGANLLLAPIPAWRHVPFGETLTAEQTEVTSHAGAAARAVARIPKDAAVSATNGLGAHLSERQRIFSFPVLREARWIAVDERKPSYRDRASAPAANRRAVRALRSDPRWELVFEEDGVLVFRRRGS